ncbi:MAG: LamG domain-containing protein, partial [Chloroflexi bacterium]|nr:LamG domain-containing protein [Chloroflexota bacterium]
FDAAGEALGYVSQEQAVVVAMQAARDEPGEYGPRFASVRMVFDAMEQEEGEDYYIVTMSFRPTGDFEGRPGQEQFFIEKEGRVAYRQVRALPRARAFPIVPVAIGVTVVAVVAVVAVVVLSGGEEADEAQVSSPAAEAVISTPTSTAPAAAPGLVSTTEQATAAGLATTIGQVSTIEVATTTVVQATVEAGKPAGIVAWWPGDGTAEDVAGGNRGTLRNGATFAPGVVGQGFAFDGVDDYVQVRDNASLNISGDQVTVALWARRTAFGRTPEDFRIMVVKVSTSAGTAELHAAYLLGFDDMDRIVAGFDGVGLSDVFVIGPTVMDSDFHYYSYVRSGNSHVLFMDGFAVASEDFTGGPGDMSGSDLFIGGVGPLVGGDSGQHFGGIIDELKIYNRALNYGDINEMYEAERGESGARTSEKESVQTAIDTFIAENSLSALPSGDVPSNVTNVFTGGAGTLDLTNALRKAITTYYYCWDSTGKVTKQEVTSGASC